MPFVKGDPNINRNGQPRTPEVAMLRSALKREGEKRGLDFWEVVASAAFENPKVMTAIVKKYVPDLTHSEIEGILNVTHMPIVKIGEVPLDMNVGDADAGSRAS